MTVSMKWLCREWFIAAAAVAAGPGLRAEPAGLCHVRPAGHHAGEPLAGPALDRRTSPPCGSATATAANVGDTVAVVITLENAGRLPVAWVLVEDLLPRRAFIYQPPSLQVQGSRIQLAMLGGRGRHTLFYQLQCNRRGYHQIGPLVVETGDLFGLHRRYRVLTSPHFLLVYPEVVPLEGFELASRRPIGEVRISHRLYEDPTRIAGVRRYEAGDPLNRIHWRATARTGQLHCKIYEPSCIVGATLLLDFHQAAYDPHHEPYRSELAVTAAASLANAVYEMDQQIGLVTNGRDAADRIRQEGWDYDIRSRKAARRAAGMLEHERPAAAGGGRDPPRAGAIAANPGNARPGGTDRRAEFRPTGVRRRPAGCRATPRWWRSWPRRASRRPWPWASFAARGWPSRPS